LTLAFVAYSALRQRVEATWPAPASLPAVILLSLVSAGTRLARWRQWGAGLAAGLTALIYVHAAVPILPIAPRRDPVGRAFGWRAVAAAAVNRARVTDSSTHATTWLGGDRYQE